MKSGIPTSFFHRLALIFIILTFNPIIALLSLHAIQALFGRLLYKMASPCFSWRVSQYSPRHILSSQLLYLLAPKLTLQPIYKEKYDIKQYDEFTRNHACNGLHIFYGFISLLQLRHPCQWSPSCSRRPRNFPRSSRIRSRNPNPRRRLVTLQSKKMGSRIRNGHDYIPPHNSLDNPWNNHPAFSQV